MTEQAELDGIILQLLGKEDYLGKKDSVVVYNTLGDIVKLDLSALDLTTLPDGLFDNFTELRELDLSRNSFDQLPVDLFKALGSLKILDLSYALNPMDFSVEESVTLPAEIFKYQKELIHLNLQGNQLENLPEEIFATLYKLEFLDLSFNLLAILPPSIGNLINLERLYLDSNFLPMEFESEYVGYYPVQEFLTPFQEEWIALHESPIIADEEQPSTQTEDELRRAFSMLEDLFD